ncbi:MAG: DedA protein [Nitrospirae bacterium]|nr:DedA protein [Nitrospirota bacterium]
MPEISGVVEHFPYLGLFVLLILGAFSFPFPEDTTLILCGFLIATGVIKPIPAIALVYAGLLTSDFAVFSVGRKYGRKIVTHKRFHKIVSPEKLSQLENKFNKWGILSIILGRHIMGLRAQLFITAGVMRMPPLKFLAADAITAPFTMLVMVGAGYIGGNSLQVIRKDITKIEHVAIVLVIVLVAIYLLYRHIRSRRNSSFPRNSAADRKAGKRQ